MTIHTTIEAWPPAYTQVYMQRAARLAALRSVPIEGIEEYYRTRPAEFIEHFTDTYDPRNAGDPNKMTRMPLVLFKRQRELVTFLHQCFLLKNGGLIEKCRDFGATWVCCAFSVWMWRFHPGSAVGWGSRLEDLVDKIGDMSSIFEKMRAIIEGLPPELLPVGFNKKQHCTYMKIINPQNGATIVGETGDNIGRGGRTTMFFKDEFAHVPRAEKIQAALDDNTNVQIDISSVNGTNNVFYKRRKAGIVWDALIPMSTKRLAVFIADWRDHPAKTQEWYDKRREEKEAEGLIHIFEQEVNRNYSASVAGVIIKAEWVMAAYDAHNFLGFSDDGAERAALDVADEGGDKNALSRRKGVVLKYVEAWGEGDTGVTARRTVQYLRKYAPASCQYDSIGVGAGVKAEINRLISVGEIKEKLTFVPWNAGGKVLWPTQRVNPKDKTSPRNKDAFANIKAQAWYAVARRFYNTWRAVTAKRADTEYDYTVDYNEDDLISIDPAGISIAVLRQLEDELSQAVAKPGAPKFTVDKKPKNGTSPNMADSVVMNYFPIDTQNYNLDAWS